VSEPSDWGMQTRLIHTGEHTAAPGATPTITPIYTSVTYLYPDTAALDEAFASNEGYVYARHGNPTVATFEQVMTVAEQGAGAVAFSSGMAALHAAILAAGTPRGETAPQIRGILAARDLYGASTSLLHNFFAAQDVAVTFCDLCDPAAFAAALETTRAAVVVLESISNPLLTVADVAAIARSCHAAGARLVVDGTLTTPILQQPLTLGADLVVHSATKYIGGHSDVTGGVVVARSGLLLASLQRYSRLLGAILGPFEAQLLTRGVKTLGLRMRQQCHNAAMVSTWLDEQPEVAHVYYPGLAEHPQHVLAREMLGGLFGAMVSFDLKDGSREALFRFVDALKLVVPATSLGDIYTLVSLPIISSHRDLTPQQRHERGIGDGLVRLSVGIEEVSDILSDLQRGLRAADAATP